jgi:hypothetical protein
MEGQKVFVAAISILSHAGYLDYLSLILACERINDNLIV